MPILRPFGGHLVAASRAHVVVAPPYDSLTTEQRDAMAAADGDSFLNALPSGMVAKQDLDQVMTACRHRVERFIAEERFDPLPGPVLAVIALGVEPNRTVAIVGDLPARSFAVGPAADIAATDDDEGRILPHERIDPDRVEQLVRYLEIVGVASSPVAVAHRPNAEVAAATDAVLAGPPRLGFQGEDGMDIGVWIVDEHAAQERLSAAVAAAGRLYIADGHHRAAALRRYAKERDADPESPSAHVLSAVIPSDQLRALPFHRRLVGATDTDPDGVVRRLRARGLDPVELDGPWQPDRPGIVALTVSGRWWSLDLRERRQGGGVEALDVRLAEREIIAPLKDGVSVAGSKGGAASPVDLAVVEPVAAPAGLAALSLPGAIGIALPSPGIEAILEVADAGETMPPKSTYITPKLRSGLLLTSR